MAASNQSELLQVRADFVELWGRMAAFWGVTAGAARVHGWLLSRADAADAEQIAEALSMSRGAVSMAVRELDEWGLVLARRAPGERKLSYAPVTDLERAVKSIVQTRKRREWDPILERLREWIPRLESQRGAETEVFRRRLEEIQAVVALADRFAKSFLEGGVVHQLGLQVLMAGAKRIGRRRVKESRSR